MKEKMSRSMFGDLLLKSLYDVNKLNEQLKCLGVDIIPYQGYEYRIGDNLICTYDDFCLDDILDSLDIEIEG